MHCECEYEFGLLFLIPFVLPITKHNVLRTCHSLSFDGIHLAIKISQRPAFAIFQQQQNKRLKIKHLQFKEKRFEIISISTSRAK